MIRSASCGRAREVVPLAEAGDCGVLGRRPRRPPRSAALAGAALGLVELGLASVWRRRAVSLKPVLDAFERVPRGAGSCRAAAGARGTSLRLGGLPGSSGAVLVAWLARTFPAAAAHGRRADAGGGGALAHRSRPADRRRRGALSPARGAGRGRAALRDRRRARRDDRGAAAGPAADPGDHGAGHRGADPGAGGARAAPAPAGGRRAAAAGRGGRGAGDGWGIAGADGDRGGGVQRPGRDPGRVRLRDGGPGAARVVGRRHHFDPGLRPHHPAVAGGAARGHGAAGEHGVGA